MEQYRLPDSPAFHSSSSSPPTRCQIVLHASWHNTLGCSFIESFSSVCVSAVSLLHLHSPAATSQTQHHPSPRQLACSSPFPGFHTHLAATCCLVLQLLVIPCHLFPLNSQIFIKMIYPCLQLSVCVCLGGPNKQFKPNRNIETEREKQGKKRKQKRDRQK